MVHQWDRDWASFDQLADCLNQLCCVGHVGSCSGIPFTKSWEALS
jgi:hypothetical protein